MRAPPAGTLRPGPARACLPHRVASSGAGTFAATGRVELLGAPLAQRFAADAAAAADTAAAAANAAGAAALSEAAADGGEGAADLDPDEIEEACDAWAAQRAALALAEAEAAEAAGGIERTVSLLAGRAVVGVAAKRSVAEKLKQRAQGRLRRFSSAKTFD